MQRKITGYMNTEITKQTALIGDIRQIIEQGKQQAYAVVNATMIATYWNIGKQINIRHKYLK